MNYRTYGNKISIHFSGKFDNFQMVLSKRAHNRACPGVEPGTSRTLSENHATRPTGRRYQIWFRKGILLIAVIRAGGLTPAS